MTFDGHEMAKGIQGSETVPKRTRRGSTNRSTMKSMREASDSTAVTVLSCPQVHTCTHATIEGTGVAHMKMCPLKIIEVLLMSGITERGIGRPRRLRRGNIGLLQLKTAVGFLLWKIDQAIGPWRLKTVRSMVDVVHTWAVNLCETTVVWKLKIGAWHQLGDTGILPHAMIHAEIHAEIRVEIRVGIRVGIRVEIRVETHAQIHVQIHVQILVASAGEINPSSSLLGIGAFGAAIGAEILMETHVLRCVGTTVGIPAEIPVGILAGIPEMILRGSDGAIQANQIRTRSVASATDGEGTSNQGL